VVGTPGSGKSTLLTKTLRLRPERLFRYYAYVPDAQDPISFRGEATNFLHDLVLDLDRASFRIGESPGAFDHDHLLERFHHQLQLLHQNWQETGQKTIILIDGLDHIAREQHPKRSLLLDLPMPNQIPDGVYVILGSQTDQLTGLPDRVQYAIRQADRRIEMQPLSREAVFQVTDRVQLSVGLTAEQKERIFFLSDGHPLALGLILKRLRDVQAGEVVEEILASTERYEGDIEAQYHSYWRQIEQDDELLTRARRS
jgi:hypothetical protein